MITFREAVLSDITPIMELERACFNRDTRESETAYRERIGAFPRGFIVMETGNEFAGAVSSELWQYGPVIRRNTFTLGHSITKQLKLSGDELYISSIGVFPQYRKQGYGELLFRALIDHVKASFPRVTRGILLINEEWKAARKIYARNGFYDVAVFDDFFTADDGTKTRGIVMRNDAITGLPDFPGGL
ncbi:hypothetical protein FACS189445_4930 [Spirochaetia bacterium]|nr:hypothetical protein FACS189445_4930 [Spirochaetia bacterium]